MAYKAANGLLAGMQTSALRLALTRAQQAYISLSTGAQGVSYTLAQGDGSKTVTYTPADLPAVSALIQSLQAQLGIVGRSRRAMRFKF